MTELQDEQEACRREGEVEARGAGRKGRGGAQPLVPGEVRSQALMRWGRRARPQRGLVGAEAAASSAAADGPEPQRRGNHGGPRFGSEQQLQPSPGIRLAQAAQWAGRRARSGDLGAGPRCD